MIRRSFQLSFIALVLTILPLSVDQACGGAFLNNEAGPDAPGEETKKLPHTKTPSPNPNNQKVQQLEEAKRALEKAQRKYEEAIAEMNRKETQSVEIARDFINATIADTFRNLASNPETDPSGNVILITEERLKYESKKMMRERMEREYAAKIAEIHKDVLEKRVQMSKQEFEKTVLLYKAEKKSLESALLDSIPGCVSAIMETNTLGVAACGYTVGSVAKAFRDTSIAADEVIAAGNEHKDILAKLNGIEAELSNLQTQNKPIGNSAKDFPDSPGRRIQRETRQHIERMKEEGGPYRAPALGKEVR